MPYHAIYITLWLIIVAYWIYGAFGNKPAAYRWNPAWRILAIIVFVTIIIFLGNLPSIMNRRVYRPSAVVEWTGIATCAAGVALAIWARRTLGKNWSGNPTIKVGHELIVSGPYRFVRHPIYTGFLVAIVGTLIGSGKVRDLVVLALGLVGVSVKLKIEESLMMRQFPEAYPEYRKRTKALIPFVL